MPTSICQWITSFLTDRQQLVRLGKYTSSTHTISTQAPQGCVLSPLLFCLYTNNCTSKDLSVKLLKFADDTTLIDLLIDVLQEKPPCSPPLTIMNSTVTAVESFRFLGTTISQDLKWDNHIDSIVKRPSRGCSSFASWGSSTCQRSCWNSSTLPSLNRSSAHQ